MKIPSCHWKIPVFMAQLPHNTLSRMGLDEGQWRALLEPYLDRGDAQLPDAFVSFDSYKTVARQIVDRCGGADFARWYLGDLCPYHLGPIGIAATSAPTLGDSLHVMARFTPVIAPAFSISVRRTVRDLILTLRVSDDIGDLQSFFVELLVLLIAKIVNLVSGGRASVRISLSRLPEFTQSWCWDLLSREQASVNLVAQLVVAQNDLAINNQSHAPHVFHNAVGQCQELARTAQRLIHISQRVRSYLLEGYAKSQNPTLEGMAESMQMSARTLARHLRGEGHNFRDLQVEARMELAKSLLRRSDHSIKAVCIRSGFTSPSAFSRAFRNYTLLSPSQYRNQP